MRLDKFQLREDELRTQVVEVWAPFQQRLITQNTFEKLYLKKRRPDYVAGIQWTFLPSIADTTEIISQATISFCEILRERQKDFTLNNIAYPYTGIINLNTSLPKMSGCQLHSILMTLRSSRTDEPLFN